MYNNGVKHKTTALLKPSSIGNSKYIDLESKNIHGLRKIIVGQ